MFLMALGICNITSNNVFAQDDSTVTQEQAQEEIKANKDTFDQAVESINNKDYQSAIVYLTAYISSKPKKYEAYKLRGDAFYALRQYVLAQKDYQTAIDLKTYDDKFITGTKVFGAVVLGADKQDQLQNPELGNLYARLMYAQKALNNPAYETSYTKAFEYNSHIYLPKPKKEDIAQINCPQKYGKVLNPQGADSYIFGAIEDIENNNYNEAVYKTQNIISNFPKYYLGYYLNGVSMVGLEQEKEAVAAFEKALQYNPYDFESLASLGQIYYYDAEKTFSPDDAKKSTVFFNKALKYNPNCYLYYYYIGLNELQLGNIDLAISNFDKAVKYKSNDYNSMYYKLIAQYMRGDYNAVVEGSTRLLYRHVSNYNSVLYLRALAQNKLGAYESALSDIEKIQNSVDDIYNADVKVVSNKEKTLESYLYYLKAQIMNEQGFGAKSDMAKALQNPIIGKLSKVENSLNTYEQTLNSSSVSLDDYKKYNDFYRAELPKLLQSDMVITIDDIDNQYDYIRTTFDNLGLSFVYTEPNYKLTTIDDYVYKKYLSKLSKQDRESIISEVSDELKTVVPEEVKPALKATTNQSEMIVGENQTSIAQMLATHSLGTVVTAPTQNFTEEAVVHPVIAENAQISEQEQNKIADAVVEVEKQTPPEIKTQKEEIKPEELLSNAKPEVSVSETAQLTEKSPQPIQIAESSSSVQENKSDIVVNEPEVANEDKKPEALDVKNDVKTELQEVIQNKDEQNIVETVSQPVPENKPEEVKPVLDEKVAKGSEIINSDNKTSESLTKSEIIDANLPVSSSQNTEQVEELPIIKENQQETDIKAADGQTPKVVEKHADVDLKQFDFVHKQPPVVDETTEVVELEPENFIRSAEKKLESESLEVKPPKSLTSLQPDTSLKKSLQTDTVEDNVTGLSNLEETAQIILPEAEPEKLVIPESKEAKNDVKVAVPVVVVPELNLRPVKKEQDSASQPNVYKVNDVNKPIDNNVEKSNSGTEKTAPQLRSMKENTGNNISENVPEQSSDSSENLVSYKKETVRDDKTTQSSIQDLVKESAKAQSEKISAVEPDTIKDFADKSAKMNKQKGAKVKELFALPDKKEKPVKIKKEKVSKEKNINTAVEKPSEDVLTPETKEVKVKNEKKKSQKELAISSFVQSTFGGAEMSAHEEDPASIILDEGDTLVSKSKIKMKKEKIKKVKIKDSELDKKPEKPVKVKKSDKKFSFKEFFARFKKSNIAEDKLEVPVENKVIKTKKVKSAEVENSDSKSGFSTFVDKFKKQKTVEKQSNSIPKVKKEKIKKEKTPKTAKVKSDADSIEKPIKLKKESLKKISEPKAEKAKVEKPVKAVKEKSKNLKKEHDAANIEPKIKEKKEFTWWFKKKENQLSIDKFFEKSSGDKGEVYVKNDKEKKVIKKLEK